MNPARYEILVCSGPTCAGIRHADHVYRALERELAGRALHHAVRAGRRKCFGFCRRGPNVYVRSLAPMDDTTRCSALYHGVAAVDVPDMVHTHVLGGRVLERLLQVPEDEGDELESPTGPGREDIRLAVVRLPEDPVRPAVAAAEKPELPATGTVAESPQYDRNR